jgi:hypothetical protein
MTTNTSSTDEAAGHSDGLAALAAAVDELATQELDGLPDGVRAQRVLTLRRLVDRLEGHWLHQLAAVDARGPPAPTKANKRPRPPAGWGTGCAWAPARPPAPSGPPGPCSGVPWPPPPRP